MKPIIFLGSIALIFLACSSSKLSMKTLENQIHQEFASTPDIQYALAFKDLQTNRTVLINAKASFHAASTMKTPVLAEVYRQAESGKYSVHDSVVVKNEFKSIADGSSYTLSVGDDSEPALYKHLGKKVSIYHLAYQMIIRSSNLATNILIEKIGADQVMQLMKSIGANDIRVLRGVEDNKAYELGMNNTTTAYDLMLLFEKIANGELVSRQASEEMIKILLDQHFGEIIPAQLPAGTKVAHKTGSISTVNHDSGIVFLPDGRKYVIVLLSRFKPGNSKIAVETMAGVSKSVWDFMER